MSKPDQTLRGLIHQLHVESLSMRQPEGTVVAELALKLETALDRAPGPHLNDLASRLQRIEHQIADRFNTMPQERRQPGRLAAALCEVFPALRERRRKWRDNPNQN